MPKRTSTSKPRPPTPSQAQAVNDVPRLANAIDAPIGAVDDIYVFTNSTRPDQYNILPSEPKPVGPNAL